MLKKINTSRNVFHRQVGQTLKVMRKAAGLTQMKVAQILELEQAAYCRIESGMQSLRIHELLALCDLYGQSLDMILKGQPNLSAVALKHGQQPSLPSRYTRLPFSHVRELLPFLMYLNLSQGEATTKMILSSLKLEDVCTLPHDAPLGFFALWDLSKILIENKFINQTNFSALIAQTRDPRVHDRFHDLYSTQQTSMGLLQEVILNTHHYQKNFLFEIQNMNPKRLDLSIVPADHLKEIPLRDSVLEDFFCRYWKGSLSEFPIYIGQKPFQVLEKQCVFKKHDRCIYEFTAIE